MQVVYLLHLDDHIRMGGMVSVVLVLVVGERP